MVLSPGGEGSKLAIGAEAILLVEDDSMVRYVGAVILRQQGYLVLEAANGKEAVQVTKKQDGEIHLMLTDVIMPDMNAIELAKQIKDSRPTIKVLFTSGNTKDELVCQGLLESEVEFIEKPHRPVDLLRKVRQVLCSKRNI